MRTPRFYQPTPLTVNQEVELSESVFHHACKVLRMEAGDAITLFNGEGGEYTGTLCYADKKRARAVFTQFAEKNLTSGRHIHLAQVFNKGDKMEFVVEKAVELGVSEITPLFSERCDVRLNGERLEKKMVQLKNAIISACEQCGMNILPKLNQAKDFSDWIKQKPCATNLILDPEATNRLSDFTSHQDSISLVIGPEGGFSAGELQAALDAGLTGIQLGQRILRTETAALAAISALQFGVN
ncbi:MAG TPA: 16S rRNA (uracil(1498)-N(3))-methyltransferase [Pseudomonadales bacterium]|nr:16S rRNA (uracil(1498)-N(3))-methyltransferase [Pseudomonadales bacterium]